VYVTFCEMHTFQAAIFSYEQATVYFLWLQGALLAAFVALTLALLLCSAEQGSLLTPDEAAKDLACGGWLRTSVLLPFAFVCGGALNMTGFKSVAALAL